MKGQFMHRVRNKSKDWKYFVITPRLVFAYARNPYDYTLWSIIKDVAGDDGECYLSTSDLAVLSMMSTGQVSNSRGYWIALGILEGEIKKDAGYTQAVWHITVPDIWSANIEWAMKFSTIASRVFFKQSQKEILDRLDYTKPSPYEGLPSVYEGLPSPGETKNNRKEKPKEEEDNGNTEKNRNDLEKRCELVAELLREVHGEGWRIVPLMKKIVVNFCKTYPDPSWYRPAFEIMAKNCKDEPSFTYVESVCENWAKHGFGSKHPDYKTKGNGKQPHGEKDEDTFMQELEAKRNKFKKESV